jgi:hypothetical protein
MIRPNKGFIMCKVFLPEMVTSAGGITHIEKSDPRIRVGKITDNNSDSEFEVGNTVYVPMGYAVEFKFREIEYMFVKPEMVVGYEPNELQV